MCFQYKKHLEMGVVMDSNWLELLEGQNKIEAILETNKYLNQFGIEISKADAQVLTEARKNSLKEQRRIEIGHGIMIYI